MAKTFIYDWVDICKPFWFVGRHLEVPMGLDFEGFKVVGKADFVIKNRTQDAEIFIDEARVFTCRVFKFIKQAIIRTQH